MLAGCTSINNSSNILSEKNIECINHQDEIKKMIEIWYDSRKEDTTFPWNLSVTTWTLQEIFYSPEIDSCLYTVWWDESYKLKSKEDYWNDYYLSQKMIINFDTTGQDRLYMTIVWCKDWWKDCTEETLVSSQSLQSYWMKTVVLNIQDFDKKIQELKWE